MKQANHHFEVISDELFFSVRDLVPYGIRPVDTDSVSNTVMEHLDGRHMFWMHPTSSVTELRGNRKPSEDHTGRVYATLRIDASNRIISGDLFRDIKRREWICSWRSEAIFAPENAIADGGKGRNGGDWHLLVTADVFNSSSQVPGLGTPEKAFIVMRYDPDMSIAGLRMVGIGADSKFQDSTAVRHFDFTMTEEDAPRRYETFRHFRIINIEDPANEKDDLFKKVVDIAIGENGSAVRRTLIETRSRIYWNDGPGLRAGTFETVAGEGSSVFEMLAPFQWSDDPYAYAILLTQMSPPDRHIFGTTLGLDGNALLHKSRFGAVVYVREIIESYLARNPETKSDPPLDELARRVQHTYIHELGHLLNLPHPWRRDRFRTPSIDANPAAISWMNYGSQYPLGDFMRASRKRKAKAENPPNAPEDVLEAAETELAIEDSERSGENKLKRPGFSDPERRWLWHAPFHQIATGGQYYTQQPEVPLRLMKSGNQFLTIKIFDAEKLGDGKYLLRKSPAKRVTYQPIFGVVEFETDEEYVKKHPFHMTFQSPMLSLRVRNDVPDPFDPNLLIETLEVPAEPLPIDWVIEPTNAGRTEENIAEDVHRQALQPIEIAGKKRQFERPFPLIKSDFLDRFGGVWKDRLTLQAVLRPYGALGPIYSVQAKIVFEPGPSIYKDDELKILFHDQFPLLLELLNLSGNVEIRRLKQPNRHEREQSDFVFTKLIEMIEQVKPGDSTKDILGYCKDRLRE